MHMVQQLSVSEMAAACGISGHTLRYYERAGLIRAVARTSGNQRRYSSEDVAWLEFLLKLRATGMPIATMRVYAQLREEGPSTITQRMELLVEHQRKLRGRIRDLRAQDQSLSEKISAYREMGA